MSKKKKIEIHTCDDCGRSDSKVKTGYPNLYNEPHRLSQEINGKEVLSLCPPCRKNERKINKYVYKGEPDPDLQECCDCGQVGFAFVMIEVYGAPGKFRCDDCLQLRSAACKVACRSRGEKISRARGHSDKSSFRKAPKHECPECWKSESGICTECERLGSEYWESLEDSSLKALALGEETETEGDTNGPGDTDRGIDGSDRDAESVDASDSSREEMRRGSNDPTLERRKRSRRGDLSVRRAKPTRGDRAAIQTNGGGVQIPRLIEILDLCRKLHAIAMEEAGSNRFVRREYQGALPKRRRSLDKILARHWKQIDARIKISLSAPERKMLTAAYDQGLLDHHNKSELEDAILDAIEMVKQPGSGDPFPPCDCIPGEPTEEESMKCPRCGRPGFKAKPKNRTGRPKKIDDLVVQSLHDRGKSLSEIARKFSVTRGAIQASLKRIQNGRPARG